jgi:hypothetical protein
MKRPLESDIHRHLSQELISKRNHATSPKNLKIVFYTYVYEIWRCEMAIFEAGRKGDVLASKIRGSK